MNLGTPPFRRQLLESISLDIPGLGSIDVVVGRGAVQCPLLWIPGVGRRPGGVGDAIELGILDVRVALVITQAVLGLAGWDLDDLHVQSADLTYDLTAGLLVRRRVSSGRRTGLELHQQLIVSELWTVLGSAWRRVWPALGRGRLGPAQERELGMEVWFIVGGIVVLVVVYLLLSVRQARDEDERHRDG